MRIHHERCDQPTSFRIRHQRCHGFSESYSAICRLAPVMFSSFEDFRRTRIAATEWRHQELEIARMNLLGWEEGQYRRALFAGSMTDTEEHRFYFAVQDQAGQLVRRSIRILRPAMPAPPTQHDTPVAPYLLDDETEIEDEGDEAPITFVSVPQAGLEELAVFEDHETTNAPAASRKRGRLQRSHESSGLYCEDEDYEPVAKRTRSAVRATEILGAAEHDGSEQA